jgi:hypothetical protein
MRRPILYIFCLKVCKICTSEVHIWTLKGHFVVPVYSTFSSLPPPPKKKLCLKTNAMKRPVPKCVLQLPYFLLYQIILHYIILETYPQPRN